MSADAIRPAFEALARGESDPLRSLFHPELTWRGRRRLRRFWRPPSCHGPDEAHESLRWAVDERLKAGAQDGRVESIDRYGRRFVVVLSWADPTGRRHVWVHALRLRDGAIAEMQDYGRPAAAAVATRCKALLDRPTG